VLAFLKRQIGVNVPELLFLLLKLQILHSLASLGDYFQIGVKGWLDFGNHLLLPCGWFGGLSEILFHERPIAGFSFALSITSLPR
jgi:hypothetical protein